MTEAQLKKAAAGHQVSHAYIVAGGDADRRRRIAQEFALALLCEGQNPPCGSCHACRQILAGTNPDLIRVTHEKPATVSVDDIRAQVSDTVGVRPYASDYKVYILDDAELMTPQAQNALLKTIEEPPAYTVLLLLAESDKLLLETIRSRCAALRLEDSAGIDRDTALCRESLALLKELPDAGLSRLTDGIALIREEGGEKEFLHIARCWYRDIWLAQRTGAAQGLVFPEEAETVRQWARRCDPARLRQAVEAIDRAEDRLRYNVSADTSLELLLMELQRVGKAEETE